MTNEAELALQALESAWKSGVVDDFATAVPVEVRGNTELLIDLACLDLENRIAHNGETRIEAYTTAFPQLANDQLVLLELIRTEYMGRSDRDSLDAESYCKRFPNLAHQIKMMFQLEFNHSSNSNSRESSDDWRCASCDAIVEGRELGETDCRECGQRIAIGRYELLERVGEGAFGYVYRARDPRLDREVAVKIPRSNRILTPEESERFLRESRHVAQLDHPGIVRIFDTGRQNGTPYIVSEFVNGLPLSNLIENRELSFRESATLISEIAKSVSHAHQRGVIHRDLKPANIMTGFVDRPQHVGAPEQDQANPTESIPDQLRPRVMDFGLARRDQSDTTVTMEGQAVGTPAYMSPEQASGDLARVGPRSDIYSLGVILFQLLCGELPFRGTTQRLMQQVIEDDAPPPTRFRASTPTDLETICLKCLERDASLRYESASELANELDRWLDGIPILARPISMAGRFTRWCKRRPGIASLSAALLIVLTGGLIGVTNQWIRAENNAKAYRLEAAENLLLAKSESAAKEKAQLEEETAVEVNEFMNDVFSEARSRRKGQLPTILAAVDSAAKRVGRKFKDRPRVEARVRFAIGRVYRGQGDREAIPHFRRAVELFQSLDGDDGQMRLKSMDRLAGALRALADNKAELIEARELRTEVVERQSRILGDNHPVTLTSLNNLALVYSELDDSKVALEMYQRVLKSYCQDPDTAPESRLITEHNIAIEKMRMGQFESAETELREILNAYEAQEYFRPDKHYLNSINSLGDTLFELEQFEEAETYYRFAHNGRLELNGPTHYATLDTEVRIGRAMVAAKKFAAVEKKSNEILKRRISEFGVSSSRTTNIRINYFNAIVGLERLEEAESFMLDSWKLFCEQRGAEEKYTRRLETRMIEFYKSHEMTDQLKAFEDRVEKAISEEALSDKG